MNGFLNNNFQVFPIKDDCEYLEVLDLDRKRMPFAWDKKQWAEVQANSHMYLFGIKTESLMGFALFHVSNIDDGFHLLKICVHEEYLGCGAAEVLFLQSLKELYYENDEVRKGYLEVEVLNHRAISFYEKLGFKRIHLKKGFYSNGEDALIMTCEL